MSIKSFFKSSWFSFLAKIGWEVYKEKNDNELTNTVADIVEEVIDSTDEETEE